MAIAGWIMTGLFVLFMLGASVTPKVMGMQVAKDALDNLGWPQKYLLLIAAIELVATLLFAIPYTALPGAILMTGLLGGALASNLRSASPLYSHTLFSVYLGVFMWAALWLRDDALRMVFP